MYSQAVSNHLRDVSSTWNASTVMVWSGRGAREGERRGGDTLLPCNLGPGGGPTADDKRAGKSGSAGTSLPVGADQPVISIFFDPLVRAKYFPYFPIFPVRCRRYTF